MLDAIMNYQDEAMLLLRVVVGIIFVYHGLPKIRKPHGMAQGMGWPAWAIVVLGLVEALGGLGILLGVYMQVAALLLALVMIGATWTKIAKWKIPFYTQTATGWEYDLVLFVVLVYITAYGPAGYSLMGY
ncbi:DoxX family protein [Candidatus Parcubacteria bacterium]|nr:DoxX family protein [Candidatus Parcubacteria bacterium]